MNKKPARANKFKYLNFFSDFVKYYFERKWVFGPFQSKIQL